MPRMRATRVLGALACLLAAAALVAGCGSGSSTSSSSSGSAESRPAPPKSEFPSAKGKTLAEVLESEEASPSELVVSPAAMVFYKGENRYPFGVFQRDRTQVPDAKVALYFARVPPASRGNKPKGGQPKAKGAAAAAEAKALDQPAVGPFPAAIESLATQPAFRAQTTADDPNAATVVYSPTSTSPATASGGSRR